MVAKVVKGESEANLHSKKGNGELVRTRKRAETLTSERRSDIARLGYGKGRR